MPERMIQRIVRVRSTVRIGAATSTFAPRTFSLAPRSGSRIRKKSAATTKPGTAATTNGARQSPNAATSGPTVKNAAISPTGSPSMKIPSARDRRSAGKRSPMSELAAGA